MYIETIPNPRSKPTILLREGKRVGKRVKKTTLMNLTHRSPEFIAAMRRLIADTPLCSRHDLFAIEESRPHGHVEIVLETIRKLRLDTLIASQRSRPRDLVLAMIVARLIDPCSKLATTRLWHASTLAEELHVEDADVDELYDALDWLLARQKKIEKKLALRHLGEGARVLYDVSSSYYEGRTCPLAFFGHSRDDKRGLPIIVYGVMTNAEGCPIAVQVYEGNTADPATVADQVEKLRGDFSLKRVLLVGDRGMLTQTQIEILKQHPGLGWISALRSRAIRDLVRQGHIQLSLFDERNLAEIISPDFPNERLIVCFNPLLAEERRRTREELIEATEKNLRRIRAEALRRTKTPLAKDQIALKVGKIIARHKMAKHFSLVIEDGRLEWTRKDAAIEEEEALDGIYVIRTSEKELAPEDAVRYYKDLSHVERAFRTLKGVDLRVRPIYHHTPDHVRAHIFLSLLAYYVEWHMRRALAPLLFDDEELPLGRRTRDPVAPATPSLQAKRKKIRRTSTDGLPIHSFHTLLQILATRCRNRCRIPQPDLRRKKKEKEEEEKPTTFDLITEPSPIQRRALELIGMFPVR